MASILLVLFAFVVAAASMTAVALFTPKGPNQVTIRTALMLTLACCYLMWMITYMAQLHPMISPVRSVKH